MKHHALTAPLMTLGRQGVKRAMNATCLLALAIGTALIVATPAMAQATSAETATRDFDIRAGALGSALLRFAEQSGLQFSVTSEMTAGKRTAGIKGKYTPEDGLRALLSGTGLTFRFTGPRTVVIEPAPETGDARVLGPLKIEGAAGRAGVSGNGVNGSTDGTATENSGTYAAAATSMVSKSVQSVLDTPQTVSVLSRKQMTEQNINDFTTAMKYAPGVTVRPGDSNQSNLFMSRGFAITKLRIDGGAPITTDYYFRPNLDMALYDHVEILRGADGMYSGYGDPGGVVNLVRKRPLDHVQTLVEGQVASWNNYRTMVDVTGPLGLKGRLRGRAVFTYEDKDYFYDLAYDRHNTVYAVLEGDVSDNFTVRGGFSFMHQTALPWQAGLPRYQTGASLGLPRSMCLCFQDAEFELNSKEYFLQGEYAFNDAWSLDAKLTRLSQEDRMRVMIPFGGINPDTGAGYGSQWDQWRDNDRRPVRNSADMALKGTFSIFGLEQNITAGVSYSESYYKGYSSEAYTFGGLAYVGRIPGIPAGDPSVPYSIDVLNFNPYDLRYRPYNLQRSGFIDEGNKEHTIYANWNASLTERLQLNVGLRYSYYSRHNQSGGYCTRSPFSTSPTLSCDVYGPDETGNWVYQYSIGLGEEYPRGRYERRDVDSTFAWPPSWSLIYRLNDNLSIYGSYTDTYISQASQVDKNYDPLPPVTGFNVEIGTNYLAEDSSLTGKLAVYYAKKEGYSVLDFDDPGYNQTHPDSSCCFVGGDDVKNTSLGLDAEVMGELLPGWQLSASYNFNYNQYHYNTSSFSYRGPNLSYAPKHMLKVWTSYQFQDKSEWLNRLNVGGGVTMQTKTYDSGEICTGYERVIDPVSGLPISSTCVTFTYYNFQNGFYAVYSGRAEYRLNDTWTLSLNINNVFDKIYYSRSSPPNNDNWYGEPRNYALVVRGKF